MDDFVALGEVTKNNISIGGSPPNNLNHDIKGIFIQLNSAVSLSLWNKIGWRTTKRTLSLSK